jgi:RNA polymerase-binding transcription factor DksA
MSNHPLSSEALRARLMARRSELRQLVPGHAELAQIDLALHRLDAGQYRKCSVCHGQIESARLEIVPYAVTCRRCT